ncbi:manganese catalase family protein, partial [Leuconostoc mesenteroides]|uniref:manganese catalase family protein n=3 Tax=Leuconostoc mesenteroides TaxID=1245 RepID=UPI002362992A
MYLRKSKLQYHAKPEKSNPIIARRLQEILGGQWGENTGMLAYTLQGWNTVGNEKYKDLLLDIGTEEIGHMEILATMINDLLRDAPTDTIEEVARNSDPATAAILGGMDPQHAFVNGIGAGLSDSNGNPWSANFIISSGNLLVDMRFNVVRESQDRLQVSRNFLQTEDKGVRDMLSYLMARETQHQLQFLKACEELEEKYGPVVPHGTQDLQKQGKEFTHTLYNFSEGETARDGNKFHYSSDPLMAGGEPDLTALSMDSQTDQLKV